MEDRVLEALKGVKYPGFNRDLTDFGIIDEVQEQDGIVYIRLAMSTRDPEMREKLRDLVYSHVKELEGVKDVKLAERPMSPQQHQPQGHSEDRNPFEDQEPVEGVKHIVAVASGKGGVGKSTVSANLAAALKAQGHKVGLLDADIYGPSMQVMMGIRGEPKIDNNKRIIPLTNHGIKMMSIGFILDPDQAVIWRGPMIMKALEQFLRDVLWEDLDYLVVDLPPGTGDAQLSLVQMVPLSGAVIVSTPQDVALIDARRAVQMFRTVNAPVVGIIENMSYFVCDECNKKHYIFDHGNVEKICDTLETEFLGEVPLQTNVRTAGDGGEPIVLSAPDDPVSQAFLKVATRVHQVLNPD